MECFNSVSRNISQIYVGDLLQYVHNTYLIWIVKTFENNCRTLLKERAFWSIHWYKIMLLLSCEPQFDWGRRGGRRQTRKTYITCAIEKLASLSIIGEQIQDPLKLLNTIVLWCPMGSIELLMISRDTSILYSITFGRCGFFSRGDG